ncbi:hypothetical protein ACIOVF_12405 [Pseudomonas sp. NPDC087612]|uniref:hypothetical protein n=1 Tax=Pseudomonas TaxID=286 RepID=UPI000695CCF9|nr:MULTISPECIES: hypothetical protein [unclassified Pseudomonas]QPG65322.1 hypothetical protein HFV04_011275 [Pseudomonas sp. BIGb0427]QVM95931.1 hypothetical protein JYG36_22970 [Pseudomonas sp. SORT22]UVM56818.1 hypothetical protein LOY37_04330 [Pseudomonas sp. B21-012]UVM67762.1 hypothetical protein LOY34_04280 [Pseudomonas sp. B21-009]
MPFNYLTLSLACYLTSLFLQACAREHDVMRGMHALALGVLNGSFWFANPLYFAALVMHRTKPQVALYLGCAALALSGLMVPLGWLGLTPVPDSANGPGLLIGYYVWLLAMLVFILGQWRYRHEPADSSKVPLLGWPAWGLVAGIVLTVPLAFTPWSKVPFRSAPEPTSCIECGGN